jgi:hypothetical protein
MLTLGACGGAGTGSDEAPRWDVREQVAIGVESGEREYEFGRIIGAVKLADGRIAVADNQNVEVRLFTAAGWFERSFGRRGGGPGEFDALTRLTVVAGDTLVAGSNSRLARYTAQGSYVDESRYVWRDFSRHPYFFEYARHVGDSVFALTLLQTSAGQPETMPLHRPGIMHLIARPEGLIDSLGVFPGLEQLQDREGSGVPLFSPYTWQAVARGYIVVGDMAADSVLLYDARQRTRTWIKLPLQTTPIPPEALAKEARAQCQWASSGEAREQCDARLRRLPEPTTFPVFQRLAVDSMGTVWVATYSHASADSTEWLVLNGAGKLLGAAILPSTIRPAQIGSTYLLGIARDSLGVERVLEFSLTRR